MDKQPLSDDGFIKKYEAYEKESVEDFIRRHSSTENELRETIAYLIRHREMMRDVEIKRLEFKALRWAFGQRGRQVLNLPASSLRRESH